MKSYIVTAKVTFNGATMIIDPKDESHAKKMAAQEPDFDVSFAEMVDFDIQEVELNE